MTEPTFDSLARRVDDDTLIVVPMLELRDAYGAVRLGDTVVTEISKRLAQAGLGHFPDPLPTDKSENVRLFRQGTRIADLVAAVRHPTAAGDELLVSAALDEDAAIVSRMKAILGGATG